MKRRFIASQFAWTFLVAAAVAVGAGGCGSSGTPSTTGGAGTGGTACNAPAIFTTYGCAVPACHSSTAPAANFDQQTPGWETKMVGMAPLGGGPATTASMCAGMNQVYLVAGSQPATGLFMDKLKLITPQCGKRMPNIGGPLTQTELNCVQTWADALTKPK
jgi:hypothetical protein